MSGPAMEPMLTTRTGTPSGDALAAAAKSISAEGPHR